MARRATEPAPPTLRVFVSADDRRNAEVAANLGLVVSAARRYSRGREVDPDLYQVGALALTRALDDGVPRKALGAAINSAIRAEVFGTECGVVVLTAEANTLRIAIKRARGSLAETLGRAATAPEVCKALGISGPKRVRVARLMRLMDARDGWAELPGLRGADGREDERSTADTEALNAAVDELPVRQFYAVVRWFGLGGDDPCGSHAELARRLGCSPDAARRRLRRGLERLREIMGAK
jgi:RNA polymerase sigma factor (sigma-70 family)